MSFETWWSKNKDLYILAGVSESMAKCIWVEAIQSVQEPLSEQIKTIMKSLE
jgi:aromatic ring hydroxylase